MVDYIVEGTEAAVVIEAALLMGEQSGERCGSIDLVGRAVGLEAVDAYVGGRVRIPAGLGIQRRDVAAGALGFAVEERLAAARPAKLKAFEAGLGAAMASW